MSDERARCHFHLREPVDGGFRYTVLDVSSFHGNGVLETPLIPTVGDVLHLAGETCVVVGRQWMFSGYGSTNWPYGQPRSSVGPMVDLFVERHPGWYADEVYEDEDEA